MNNSAFDDISRKLAGTTSRRGALGIAARAGLGALAARFVPGVETSVATAEQSHGGSRPRIAIGLPETTWCTEDDLPVSQIEEPGMSIVEPTPCLEADLANATLQDESVRKLTDFLQENYDLRRMDNPASMHIYAKGEYALTSTLVGLIAEDPESTLVALIARQVIRDDTVDVYCVLLENGEPSRVLLVTDENVVDESGVQTLRPALLTSSTLASRSPIPMEISKETIQDCSFCEKGCEFLIEALGFFIESSVLLFKARKFPALVKRLFLKDLKNDAVNEKIKSTAMCSLVSSTSLIPGLCLSSDKAKCLEGAFDLCNTVLGWIDNPWQQAATLICPGACDHFSDTLCSVNCDSDSLIVCGDICVDASADPNHCGSCGNSCGEGRCTGGRCIVDNSDNDCESGLSNCDGNCVDVLTDVNHCGECNLGCDGTCVDGVCEAVPACDEGWLFCDGQCVDVYTGGYYCESCENYCPSGMCDGSICYGTACQDDGLEMCFGQCVDTSFDNANCGACGFHCEGDCSGGTCTPAGCNDGLTACPGGCVDVSSDWYNCGSCGNWCSSGGVCAAGQCVCTPGLTECGGDCVDLTSHPYNCGGCGVPCEFGCSNGQCLPEGCGPGLTVCYGWCVDTSWDSSHCGGCGIPCDGECSNGECIAAGCGDGLTDCGNGCVDLSVDPENCGTCGDGCTGECKIGLCYV